MPGSDEQSGSITRRFEQQVREHPERMAIEDCDSTLTYGELNRLANRLAHAILAECGARSEPVALLVGDGVPVVSAMLGALKAGKFYVTLDPCQPAPRLLAILAETRPRLVIADAGRMEQAESLCQAHDLEGTRVLNEDALDPGVSADNPDLAITPSDLAYVVFTSGSTGTPKGVMQDHGYVLHLTAVYTEGGGISAADRLGLLYSPAFAGAVRDIYCALLNGAALLTFDVKRQGLASLAGWMREKHITAFFAVATMFRHFCRLLAPEDRLPDVRLIELGSETVYAGEVHLFQRHFSRDCRLMVNLGGSEISPVCQFAVDAATRIEGNTVPAGWPAGDVEVLLWDAEGKPAPEGAPGEIVVRSRYLTRGYWGRPDLTDAVFLPDPDDGGRRLFRTGDLGRFLPHGCLMHLGRRDFQVKIRGYRVETAEVEAFFTGTALIRDAAVAARADASGEPNLVAWLVPVRGEAPPSVSELRRLAHAALPDYMVPARIVVLDSLPLTENGKLDRRALPDPWQAAAPPAALASQVPRNAVETRLQEIWREVLGREDIGRDESFFDLGGHSLLAMQVVARIGAAFRVTLRPNCLFDSPTLAQLAGVVEAARQIDGDDTIQPAPGDSAAPLSLAQQRLWVLDQMDGPSSIFTMVRVFRLDGALDVSALERALAEIGRRHDNLRVSFPMWREGPVQMVAPQYQSVLSCVDLRNVADDRYGAALDACLREAHAQCFDLVSGPLWSVRLIRLDANLHVLHLAMHHIISDDWSIQVLLGELSARYGAILAGGREGAPEFAVQYADYARWQRRWLGGERLAGQLAYWMEHLRGAPPLLELPLDRPREEGGEFCGGTVRLRLDGELTTRLRRLSRESETTLFVTLLAAYGVLLSHYGNGEDIVIGTAVANRHPVETEAMIGFFVNALALRLRWRAGASFREIQASAHRAAVGGFAHPDVPFDQIVDALQPDRGTPYSPVFQAMFVLQNVPEQPLTLSALTVTSMEVERTTAGATFDLTLSLKETSGKLGGALEFNAAVFDRTTIERMATHFESLLEGIVRCPDEPAGTLLRNVGGDGGAHPRVRASSDAGVLR